MDQETQNIIKDRFEMLPPDVKKAVSDVNLPAKIENIATKNNLHIDQSGGLLTEIYLVMLGVDKSENFAKNVSKNLGITLDLAMAIEGDISREIFLPIRASLMKISQAQDEIEKTASTDETIPNPERDQILHDIENPTPTVVWKGNPITDPERELENVATNSFVASKLSQPSVAAKETATITEPVIEKKPQVSPSYTTDPYREPAN